MDEPTEGLDPNQRTEIRALIKKLGQDRTIILSTHVMQEATAVATRLLIISQGKLVADGTPEELTALKKDEIILQVTLEGKQLATTLKKIPNVTSIEAKKLGSNKYELQITTRKATKIQPELTKLASKHNWIIWQLNEYHRDLEQVFHKLTQEK